MSSPIDYSKTAFSPGIVCYNTNNKRYCVVLDGAQGTENDRTSLVIEFCDNEGFILHTPPNRALIPTGRVNNLAFLAKAVKYYANE